MDRSTAEGIVRARGAGFDAAALRLRDGAPRTARPLV